MLVILFFQSLPNARRRAITVAFTAAQKKLSEHLNSSPFRNVSEWRPAGVRLASTPGGGAKWEPSRAARAVSKPVFCHNQPGNATNLKLTFAEHQPQNVCIQSQSEKAFWTPDFCHRAVVHDRPPFRSDLSRFDLRRGVCVWWAPTSQHWFPSSSEKALRKAVFCHHQQFAMEKCASCYAEYILTKKIKKMCQIW